MRFLIFIMHRHNSKIQNLLILETKQFNELKSFKQMFIFPLLYLMIFGVRGSSFGGSSL